MHKTQLHFRAKNFYLKYIDYRSEHMQQSESPPRGTTSAKVKYVLMSQQ